MANRPGLRVSDEEYNRHMDEAVEAHRNFTPEIVPQFQKLLERFENFMEKRGTPIPRHSHRFKPENLWPDEEPVRSRGPIEQEKKDELPAESARPMGTTERLLRFHGIPVTRQNWIDLAFAGKPPKEWTYEHEMGLPPHLRDTSRWESRAPTGGAK